MANLEENNNTQQATSNIETADEVQQQQPTHQPVDGSNGIVITTRSGKKATTKATNDYDDGPLDYYARFDGEYNLYMIMYAGC